MHYPPGAASCLLAAIIGGSITMANGQVSSPTLVSDTSPEAVSGSAAGLPICKPTNFGDPLPGLTPAQLALFITGSNQFVTLDGAAQGLGPIVNSTNFPNCPTTLACASCHAEVFDVQPAIGGLASFAETRFGILRNGVFNPLAALGGSLLQNCALPGGVEETNPVLGVLGGVTAKRQVIPVFGDGLIEAIPDGNIILNALHSRGNGVNGRPALIADVGATNACGKNPIRVGRFGWKAQLASLRGFSGDAYDNEMDVSNPVFPFENEPNAPSVFIPYANLEDLPGPDGKADIDRFTDFMRLLAPPPPLPLTPSAVRGAFLFKQIGCAQCHTPTLFTGPSPIQALAFKPVNLYSDLVLHNMGSLNDNIAQGAAQYYEMRTPPLWGVRARADRLNHDGLSVGVPVAISRHSGEAAGAKARFNALPINDQTNLVNFVLSL